MKQSVTMKRSRVGASPTATSSTVLTESTVTLPNYDVANLLSKYTSILTESSRMIDNKTAHSGNCRGQNNEKNSNEVLLTLNDSSHIRFMEKIMLTEFSKKKNRKQRNISFIPPNCLSRNRQNLLRNSMSNPKGHQSPKGKLVLPIIKPQQKPITLEVSNMKKKHKAKVTYAEGHTRKRIHKRQSFNESCTIVIQRPNDSSLIDNTNTNTTNIKVNTNARPDKIFKSNKELVNVKRDHSIKRNGGKLKTISYNPYLKNLFNKAKVDNEKSLIRDFIVKSSIENSIEKDKGKAKPTHYMFTFDKVLNIQSFSIHGVFEGKGIEASFLSSYCKNTFSSLITQSLTYDFKSSMITSKEMYSAMIRNDYNVLKELWDKVKELIAISNVNLNSTLVSFCIVFIIGRKVIAMSYGDTQAIALEKKVEKDKEQFVSVSLSIKDDNKAGNDELYISSHLITEESISIVIGTGLLWDEARPYYNVTRVLALDNIDNKTKAELLVHCKKKQALCHGSKGSFAFIIIDFI